jgi:DNA-3-methyladenine glycosylase II
LSDSSGFEVGFPGPLDVPASVASLRHFGDDLLDRWDGSTLVRTVPDGLADVAFACRWVGTIEAPAFEVRVEDGGSRALVESTVGEMFVLEHVALAELAERDPVIARLRERYPGVRPILTTGLLRALVRAISTQQVNLRWAATTRQRLARTYGRRHLVGDHEVYSLSPPVLADASPVELRAMQFSNRKAEYLIAAARAVADGTLDIDWMRRSSDEEVINRITAQRGLGLWTAEWILARTLGRPRVVAGDLGLRRAVGVAYLDGRFPSEAEVRRVTAHWGAAAGVAQQLVLHNRSVRGGLADAVAK